MTKAAAPAGPAAIKWPVWTRDVLDMSQGSAAKPGVTVLLGKLPRGFRDTD